MSEGQAIAQNDVPPPGGETRKDAPARSGRGPARLRKYLPIALILVGFVGFFALGLDSLITFDSLKQNRQWLLDNVARNYLLTVLAFIAVYALVVVFSLPAAAVLSIAGGFLFGQWFGTAWNVIAATTGATILFVAARTAFSDLLHSKAGPWLQRVEAGFQENAFNYLLALRLVPLMPFFIVNLVPAFLGVTLRTFVAATFIGIIPGGFVYTSIGAGLGEVIEKPTLGQVLNPTVLAATFGLIALSLLPVAFKIWRGRRG